MLSPGRQINENKNRSLSETHIQHKYSFIHSYSRSIFHFKPVITLPILSQHVTKANKQTFYILKNMHKESKGREN